MRLLSSFMLIIYGVTFLKKITALLLSLTILMGSVSQGLISYATENKTELSVYDFAEDLSELICTYSEDNVTDEQMREDIVVTVDKFFNNFQATELNGLSLNSFETRRLVVKSAESIDYCGAIDSVSGYNDLYVLQYDSMTSAKEAYEYYLTLDCIDYVEPDIIMSCQGVDDIFNEFEPEIIFPEDGVSASDITNYLSDKIGFNDIKNELKERINDDYVLVAVIDSGADTDHELLQDRIIDSGVNYSGTGIHDSCEDDYGHGTHVAGIIASNTLDNVKIEAYKVLNSSGKGSLSAIAVTIDIAVADGADIINLSLTAKGESERMTEAINNAVANDVNVVVAAGNNEADLDKQYYTPACVESAITVSATDENAKLASFSNYDGTIDIAALGVGVKSSYLDNTYAILSGTSMAAPQVAAGLAIVKTVFPELSISECEEKIEEYAIKMYELPGSNKFGAGLLFLKYLLGDKPITPNPVFSVDDCEFSQAFEVEITCPDEDATIYYLKSRLGEGDITDWVNASEYTEPLTISVDTRLYAIAMGKGKKISSIVKAEYNREVNDVDDDYDINSLGYITAYYGDENNIVVPDTIKGKKVKGIASSAFENDTWIRSIVLPDSATIINSKAFQGCTALVSVSGQGVTTVKSNAFAKSSVCYVDFPNLKEIGNKAFLDCCNLADISLFNVETIGEYSFQNTVSMEELDSYSILSIGASAFEQSGIDYINLPGTVEVGKNAFASCESLTSASIPMLTELGIGVFKNCTSLKELDMPLLVNIKSNALRNTGLEFFYGKDVVQIDNYAFAESTSLASVYLPSTKSSGTNAFKDCRELQIVTLPSIVELNSNSFSNCPKLKILYLPSVKSVGTGAFYNSSIEYLQFECVEEIHSLPETLKGIALPGSLNSIAASTPDTDFVVFGYENTYAEQYALENEKEFQTIPAIIYETDDFVEEDSKYIFVYALGFNCTYQWYENDCVSNQGGIPIDGAVHFYYEPKAEDDAVSYYCEIKSTDGTYVNTVTTHPIINKPEYRTADLSEYNKVVEEVNALDRNTIDETFLAEIDELLSIDVSNLTYANQDIIDNIVNEIELIFSDINSGYLVGDTNNDGILSAYDARLVLRYVAEIDNVTSRAKRISDINGDGEVSSIDARMILKLCIEA